MVTSGSNPEEYGQINHMHSQKNKNIIIKKIKEDMRVFMKYSTS